MASDTGSPPQAPSLLDERYVRVRELGTGAFGAVFVYRDRELDRDVAIKFCAEPDPVLSIRDEARRLASLDHPNIVQVHTILYLPEGQLALVMQLVRGTQLYD